MKNIKLLFQYTEGNKRYFLMAMMASFFATMMQMISPLLFQYTIDSVINNTKPAGKLTILMDVFGKNIYSVGFAILMVSVLASICLFFKGRLSAVASENVVEKIKNKLYSRLQHMPYDYYSNKETGDLIQRCTSDVETVRKLLALQLIDIFGIIVMLTGCIWVMYNLNVKMMVLGVFFFPVFFVSCFLHFSRMQKVFKNIDEAEGTMTNVLQENISGVRVVRAFGQEAKEIQKFDSYNKNHVNLFDKMIKLLANFWSLIDGLHYIQIGMVTVGGVYFAVQGEITLGIFTAFILYEGMLIHPIKRLGRLLSDLGKASVAVGRIDEVLNEQIEEPKAYELEPKIEGDIEFKGVNFSYGEQEILKDISFKIKKGQTVGILGATGSGKTTLVHLLQRLHEYDGSIKIDGVELNQISKKYIRKKIGLVLQEPYLYAKTVKENIAITCPSIDEEMVYQAASMAAIHDNILSFSKGYDTIIGEKGVSLSGGQKQRIAIARNIIDPEKSVIIFDDSLSAVDTETDIKIREGLKNLGSDKTTIIISHRMSTLSETDFIIVLDQGKIAEIGNHKALISQNGVYKKIWYLQKGSNQKEVS